MSEKFQEVLSKARDYYAPNKPKANIRQHAVLLLAHWARRHGAASEDACLIVRDRMDRSPDTVEFCLAVLETILGGHVHFELGKGGENFGVPPIPLPSPCLRDNWRFPVDDGGQPLMVAYDYSGKNYAMRFGKLLQKCWEGAEQSPHLTAVLLWMGGELGNRWGAAAQARKLGTDDPNYRLVVSAHPTWFELAYRGHADFGSCMGSGRPALVSDAEAANGRKRLTLSNSHMNYYTGINAGQPQGEAPRVRQAILFRRQGDKWKTVARCLVWRVKTPEGDVQYADRPYGYNLHMKEILNAKLLIDGVAEYAKAPDASCHDAFAVHDKGGTPCRQCWLREWEIPNVDLKPTSSVAFGDTFKFYDRETHRLIIYGPRHDGCEMNLETTSHAFGGFWSDCIKCGKPFRSRETGARHVDNDHHYCPECAKGSFRTCDVCHSDTLAELLVQDAETGQMVCPTCAAAHLDRCDTCRHLIPPHEGVVVQNGDVIHRFCSTAHAHEAGWRRCDRCGEWKRSEFKAIYDASGDAVEWCGDCYDEFKRDDDLVECPRCGNAAVDSSYSSALVWAYYLTGETRADGLLAVDRGTRHRVCKGCAPALGYAKMWTGDMADSTDAPHLRWVKPYPAEESDHAHDHDGAGELCAVAQEGGAV